MTFKKWIRKRKKYVRSLNYLFGYILTLQMPCFASEDASFLLIPSVGEASMKGGCCVAAISSVFAPLYNDAVLGIQPTLGAAFSQARFYPISSFFDPFLISDYWVLIFPLPKVRGGIGISGIFVNEFIRGENSLGVSTDFSYKISYGRELGKYFSFGTGVKMISPVSDMIQEQDKGPYVFYAFDISMLFRKETISIGGSLQNIGPSIKYEGITSPGDTQKINSPLPTLFCLGWNYGKNLSTKKRFNLCTDIRKGIGKNIDYGWDFTEVNIGCELILNEKIFLGVGGIFKYFQPDWLSQITYGCGINIDKSSRLNISIVKSLNDSFSKMCFDVVGEL